MLPSATVFTGGNRDVDSPDSQCPGCLSGPSPFRSRSADHDRRHSGIRHRRDRREPAWRDRRSAQHRHELRPDARDRVGRPVRVPSARARELPDDVHAVGVCDAHSGEHRVDCRSGHYAACRDEGLRCVGNGDGDDRDCRDRDVADFGRDNAEPGDDRHDSDSRAQVRRPPDAHAGRQRRAGT